jgi:hypothetical protein
MPESRPATNCTPARCIRSTVCSRVARTCSNVTPARSSIALTGSTGLDFATTIHSAQGVSADTMHGLLTGQESRQQLYTMLTRGRHGNSSIALLRLAALANPAAAAPPGAGLDTFPATCGGQPVTVTTGSGGGASFWLGDQHYLLTSIDAAAGPGTFHKDFGHRTGLQGTEIQCTATIVEPEGLVTIDVTAVAVP